MNPTRAILVTRIRDRPGESVLVMIGEIPARPRESRHKRTIFRVTRVPNRVRAISLALLTPSMR